MASSELLQSLGAGSGVRGATISTSNAGGSNDAVSTSFDDLLAQARQGGLQSKARVKIGKGLDIQLSPSQLERVGAAADVAQANGANRALVLVDGRAYRVDVATRTIIGEAVSTQSAAMADIDAVVTAPAADGASPPDGKVLGPPSASAIQVPNAAVRKLFEQAR
jgi:hypothetical protein